MYEAMEHPAVNSYTTAVHCTDSTFVDDVFDVMLCNDAMDVSIISDEIVTECVNEQMCALSQTDDDNCDGNVGLGAPLMAEAPAAAPLQIIDLDNTDGILHTGDSINPTGKPELSVVIGDNNDLAFSDDRQVPQQQYAELINFAASDLEGGIGNGTDQGSSGVTTDSGSDAAEQTVIREVNQIIMRDADEESGAQILTGDVSELAQLSDEIDAAQMSSVSQPQCKTGGPIDGTVSLTEKPGSRTGNYDVNSSVVSHSAAAIVELGVAAELICPPVAINGDNLTMAAVTGHSAGQASPGIRVLITQLARQRACHDTQIIGDSTTNAAELRTDIDANKVDDVNPVDISAHQTDMDSHDNVPRSDELQGVRDIKLKSDLTPRGRQADGYQSYGGLQKGVSDTRDKAVARGPEQVTVVEPYGMDSPQTVMINGDNSEHRMQRQQTQSDTSICRKNLGSAI